MKAEIITIGDEILIGQIVDTNSAWMGQQLQKLGIPIVQITSISDQAQAITKSLSEASKRAEIILVTGGLGPTKDDITKHTAAAYFQTTLRTDGEVLAHVTNFFTSRGRPMLPINEKQAEVLANAEVLFNDQGTAPGMWVTQEGIHYIFMPGVPFEMKFLMEQRVIPKLKALKGVQAIWHENLLIAGLGESFLAAEIEDIENSLPTHIKLAYLPTLNLVRLRLSAMGESLENIQAETRSYADLLAARLAAHVIDRQDRSLPAVIIQHFTENGLTLSTCESCTGGSLAAQFTAIPGASKMFIGGTIPYSNRLKELLADVPASTLNLYGAVSEQTVRAMANGTKNKLSCDYALATSGIAGPDGGTAEKPVGTIWIAVAGKYETLSKCLHLKNDRSTNIARTQLEVLFLLWNLYIKELSNLHIEDI